MKEKGLTLEGCLGHSVPVKIHAHNDFHWESDGEVTALNPKVKVGDWQQPKGLYLETYEYVPGIEYVKTATGKDVTKFVKKVHGHRVEVKTSVRYSLFRLPDED